MFAALLANGNSVNCLVVMYLHIEPILVCRVYIVDMSCAVYTTVLHHTLLSLSVEEIPRKR